MHNLMVMGSLTAAPTDAELDRLFGALADPTRRDIVARLRDTDLGVVDLSAHFTMSQPAISKHLQVLERAGLVTRERVGRRRPCQLTGASLQPVSDWVSPYRRFWQDSFDRLDQHLAATDDPS
jgi:DNA-binding transcriptional ArsR family regulator